MYKVKSIEKEFPVKLQCIICTEKFNVYTEHNCLMRQSNQEFYIKYAKF